mmetsp:Transcript_6579/g.16003  ORF Transcript_6579/g.16003 Transcript_6579/m.16003 type:complete len:277 (-) Transcript_6579:750-1580(-)
MSFIGLPRHRSSVSPACSSVVDSPAPFCFPSPFPSPPLLALMASTSSGLENIHSTALTMFHPFFSRAASATVSGNPIPLIWFTIAALWGGSRPPGLAAFASTAFASISCPGTGTLSRSSALYSRLVTDSEVTTLSENFSSVKIMSLSLKACRKVSSSTSSLTTFRTRRFKEKKWINPASIELSAGGHFIVSILRRISMISSLFLISFTGSSMSGSGRTSPMDTSAIVSPPCAAMQMESLSGIGKLSGPLNRSMLTYPSSRSFVTPRNLTFPPSLTR